MVVFHFLLKTVWTPGEGFHFSFFPFFFYSLCFFTSLFLDEGRRKRQRINGDDGDILEAHLLSAFVKCQTLFLYSQKDETQRDFGICLLTFEVACSPLQALSFHLVPASLWGVVSFRLLLRYFFADVVWRKALRELVHLNQLSMLLDST